MIGATFALQACVASRERSCTVRAVLSTKGRHGVDDRRSGRITDLPLLLLLLLLFVLLAQFLFQLHTGCLFHRSTFFFDHACVTPLLCQSIVCSQGILRKLIAGTGVGGAILVVSSVAGKQAHTRHTAQQPRTVSGRRNKSDNATNNKHSLPPSCE